MGEVKYDLNEVNNILTLKNAQLTSISANYIQSQDELRVSLIEIKKLTIDSARYKKESEEYKDSFLRTDANLKTEVAYSTSQTTKLQAEIKKNTDLTTELLQCKTQLTLVNSNYQTCQQSLNSSSNCPIITPPDSSVLCKSYIDAYLQLEASFATINLNYSALVKKCSEDEILYIANIKIWRDKAESCLANSVTLENEITKLKNENLQLAQSTTSLQVLVAGLATNMTISKIGIINQIFLNELSIANKIVVDRWKTDFGNFLYRKSLIYETYSIVVRIQFSSSEISINITDLSKTRVGPFLLDTNIDDNNKEYLLNIITQLLVKSQYQAVSLI